jgi:hypothetical protein
MDEVAKLPSRDRADLFAASANQRSFSVPVVEKDFWVCWTLKRLFTLVDPPAGLIFKGGTSLSKVFAAIERFSEDVDLSINRADLGFGGANDPSEAPSKKKQQAGVEDLVVACQAMVRDDLLPRLTDAFAESLDSAPGSGWQIELDPDEEDQHYDVVRLYQGDIGKAALRDTELLKAVSRHNRVFFARAWAKFDEAVPGSLRLVPPSSRIAELARDYQNMREEMIFGHAPTWDELLDVLREIERQVNAME